MAWSGVLFTSSADSIQAWLPIIAVTRLAPIEPQCMPAFAPLNTRGMAACVNGTHVLAPAAATSRMQSTHCSQPGTTVDVCSGHGWSVSATCMRSARLAHGGCCFDLRRRTHNILGHADQRSCCTCLLHRACMRTYFELLHPCASTFSLVSVAWQPHHERTSITHALPHAHVA